MSKKTKISKIDKMGAFSDVDPADVGTAASALIKIIKDWLKKSK